MDILEEQKEMLTSNGVAPEVYGSTSTGRSDSQSELDAHTLLTEEEGASSETSATAALIDIRRRRNEGCFFRDKTRKIDYVLVWEESQAETEQLNRNEGLKNCRMRKREWRDNFMTSLAQSGLDHEEEVAEGGSKLVHYIKLHACTEVLCVYAEELSMRAPLQALLNPDCNFSAGFLAALKLPNVMQLDVPHKPPDFYTCQFKRSKLSRFLGSENMETYFSNRDRQRIAYEILSTAAFGNQKKAEIGIARLLKDGAYRAAFPLHDGEYELPEEGTPPELSNPRQLLYKYWARWGCWYKYQPLDHIREYFGEKVAIYFAWLGFYTAWLLPTSAVGLLVFLYGLVTLCFDVPSNEVCSSGDTYRMCPLCKDCRYWHLSDVCIFSKISYLFDQPGTVFYAIFSSFWAVSFLEYWKRKQASLIHHWDCMNFEEEEERPRPEYAALAPFLDRNPITGVEEPYFPKRKRIPRIISGFAVIIIMICLVIIFIVAVIMYRAVISVVMFRDKHTRSFANLIASATAAIVNLLCIMVLGKVYEKLAYKLTQWEMHRTQSAFENQLILKVFCFQFVNFYSSIFYVGFFKGKFVGYPGRYTTMRTEECQNGGCLVELAMQLGVIMIGKQMINNAQEILVPKFKAAVHHWKFKDVIGGTASRKTRWEEDFELISGDGLFDEYLEMILQFGFISIFVAAFPLAPLFALFNNWIEIRLDAHKFVCETRRPVAERCSDIGVWFTILDGLAKFAVISNAFLIAFTSDFIPKIMYERMHNSMHGYTNFTLSWSPTNSTSQPCRYKDFRDQRGQHTSFFYQLMAIRFLFVVVFEHVVFGICRLIDITVPDVPESLATHMKRERYLAKQALSDTDNLLEMTKGGKDARPRVRRNERETLDPTS